MCVCVCHFLLHASSGACLCVTVTRGARAHSQCLHTSLTYICRWVRSAWREQTEMCADDDPVKLPQMPPSTEEFEAEDMTLGNPRVQLIAANSMRASSVFCAESLTLDYLPTKSALQGRGACQAWQNGTALGGPSKRTFL